MSKLLLTPAERKVHRALAHHLDPVVMVGQEGLTPAVIKAIDQALNAHGLIKVRVLSEDRSLRETMLLSLAEDLNAAPIQHIGKLLVLWRPIQAKERKVDPDKKPGPTEYKILKNSSRGGQKPQIKRVTVLGNQRLTAGGLIKRAKSKKTSVKKKQTD